MRSWTTRPGAGAFLLFGILVLATPGCSVLEQFRPPPPAEPVEVPQLPPKPDLPTAEVPAPEVPVSPPPQPEPVEAPPEPVVEPDEPLRLAVLLTSRIPDYEAVAVALRDAVGDLDVYDLSDKSLTPKEIFETIRAVDTDVVVAVGYRAAAFASTLEDFPVVYSQVFNTGQLDLASDRVKGVSVLPPLDRQLDAWRQFNPSLSSVGAIVGPGHETLLAEAERAAAGKGIRFGHRLAQSDREALYLFTRMVPEIDGFWLFPDNRILSKTVLREMLSYAARHRVQVAVFNDSLLSIGATISTTAVDRNIAETILLVAEQLTSDGASEIPPMSPLTDIKVRVNDDAVSTADIGVPAEGGR
jgi:ABC-type uncharacterized transport system substrate-binding protein